MTMLCNDELSFISNGPYPIILIIYYMSHIMNTIVYYIWKLLRVNPKNSHHKEKIFLKNLYLCEVMDIHQTYCSNHFIMYVSQIIMLYTLSLKQSALSQKLNKPKKSLKTSHKDIFFFFFCSTGLTCFKRSTLILIL